MAATIRSLMRFNVGLVNNTLLRNNVLNSCRFLYSEKSLGLNGYENARLNFRNQFLNVESDFRTKMQQICETDSDSNMIFTEDLKSMLHLAQKKPEDIELIIKMLTKFNNQNKQLRFGTFVFGPVVMRTFYYLDEPDLALTAFKDPQFEHFFNQLTSYQILLTLLYKHKKYSEMRDVYDIIKTKNMETGGYPINSSILIMAACYKENTPETLEYALTLWKELNEKGCQIMRRASTFVAALAIKQNSPHIAIEILSTLKEARYIDVRCLKVVAYTDLKRFTEIVPILRASIEHDRPHLRKECYFVDVIEKLEDVLTRENVPKDFELYKLIKILKENNHMFQNILDEHLCMEINPLKRRLIDRDSDDPMKQRQREFTSNRDIGARPVLQNLL
ncbi:pentatricopeptide repeat-containing protein 2, mitochondrial [Linepithema humile]|uniref:pentatricopeptide repeat-containing protein 2, mitochondrial n=1 Tax=Linepithema humile TaxID=83485 RepID=UPI0006236EB4|nr:PREDICTED: pentatricopeptide repeat-containing protein 2, mitochondrial-like [Linepithema humile]